MNALLVALGAMVGAPLRYLTDRFVQARHDTVFPWGTLTVNLCGSALLGLLVGGLAAGAIPTGVGTALGTGFCGALTTYSTLSYETLQLASGSARLYAVLNLAASLFGGLGAALTGWALADALWPRA